MNPGTDVTRKNREIVRQFTRTFKNEHNVDGIDHLFASDFQDVVVTEEDLIAADDKVVERSSAVATHRAPLMGEQPTNKQVRWTEVHIYRIRDGKIAEHWVEWAVLELLKQIGAAK